MKLFKILRLLAWAGALFCIGMWGWVKIEIAASDKTLWYEWLVLHYSASEWFGRTFALAFLGASFHFNIVTEKLQTKIKGLEKTPHETDWDDIAFKLLPNGQRIRRDEGRG